MKPVTIFSNSKLMYKALRELLASHPEYLHFDDGERRIVEIPPQQFPPVNECSLFILMEHYDTDGWMDAEPWLAVMSDGRHPDGYASLQEAQQALKQLVPFYFEHQIEYDKLPYESSEEDPYPYLDDDYGLLGHTTINMNGSGVLAFWSQEELNSDTQQMIEHELVPDRRFYNNRHYQTFSEFQAWYMAFDELERQNYWNVKRAIDVDMV